jgi:surfactin synthase thioesterase subunit
LLCLPFAGGSSAIYRTWKGAFGEDVEVHALELPGRGARFGEPARASMDALLASLDAAVRPLLDAPLAVFGHSMGGNVGFALARRLGDRVKRLFVSATGAPDMPPRQRLAHLSDRELTRELGVLGGTPPEALAHAELMALLLPTIRADLAVSEGYHAEGVRLACPITMFRGTEDELVNDEEAEGWRRFAPSDDQLRTVVIQAGHFYLESARDRLFAEITRDLAAV